MLKNSLHTKWVACFFVLIYLLLITSTGNAFFWCKDAETNPHLEFNLSGKCWTPCITEPEEQQRYEQTSSTNVVFSSTTDDCVDSPAYSSVVTSSNQNRSKNKVTITDINTPSLPIILAKRLSAESLGNLSPAHQLPPRQALTALRTVVLLH